jgi:hypothetical protein
MAQPQMARITCWQCNACYSSEHELRDHMRTAHRAFGSEQSLSPSSVQAEQQEEYTQPDEEKEAGGEA